MYQHGRNELSEKLSERIRVLITSPRLLGDAKGGTRDGFIFERLFELTRKHFGIDDKFATGISEQLIRLFQIAGHDVFYEIQ